MEDERLKVGSKILSFLSGNKRIMLLKGTYQNKKLPLAIASVVNSGLEFKHVLLRFNSFHNRYLSQFRIDESRQRSFALNGYSIVVDGMASRTQTKTPQQIDCAIVYPVDRLKADAGDACIQDLFNRRLRKLIFVTWTDNTNLKWLDQFEPVTLRYDVGNLDPELHAEMLRDETAVKNQTASQTLGKRLPRYAQNCPPEFLIQLYCRQCGGRGSKFARLNKPYPGPTNLKKAPPLEYQATCLKCGNVATDNYNWFGQS